VSAFSTRSGTADCSSYFFTTVTPATYTTTTTFTAATGTVTVTGSTTITTPTTVTDISTTVTSIIAEVTSTSYVELPKRENAIALHARQETIAPSNIPAYASACSDSVAYSSACSCVGVTAMTTTAPTPTYVYTQIVTDTQTEFDTNTYTLAVTSTQIEIDTITTETTTTIVATATPIGVDDCTGTNYHTSTYGEDYQEMCGMTCSPSAQNIFDLVSGAASFTDCITICSEQNSIPNLVVYNIDTATCVCWTSYDSPACSVDVAYDSAYFAY